MAGGVPAGAISPYQELTSKPGRVSETAGTLGSSAARLVVRRETYEDLVRQDV